MNDMSQELGHNPTTLLINRNIGNALRELRECAGYTLEEAAAMLQYNADKLDDIERGNRRINLHTFLQYVATYGGHITVDAPNRVIPLERYGAIPPFDPSSQKTDTDTPPVKTRRPRIVPPQSKN